MTFLGDFVKNDTLYAWFNTRQTTGAPITLAGSPVVSIYEQANTTQTTTGVTLTVDFDSVTGMHQVAIVTTDSFYESGKQYAVVVTTGTVGGTSVVGSVVGTFSLDRIGPSMNRTLTESYATDGSEGSAAQLLYMILSVVSQSDQSDTTITTRKLDGSTAAMTYTLDDATKVTSRTRAT